MWHHKCSNRLAKHVIFKHGKCTDGVLNGENEYDHVKFGWESTFRLVLTAIMCLETA
jgi:hypothetical protein